MGPAILNESPQHIVKTAVNNRLSSGFSRSVFAINHLATQRCPDGDIIKWNVTRENLSGAYKGM
jgi:hypothetical protein